MATVTVTATTGGVANSPKTISVSQAAGGTTNPFKYICLKVGQGDAAVLVSPTGKVALIDGSYNNTVGTTIWKFLRDSIGTHHLDYIFTSHLHSDHIGGTDLVIDSLCAHGMDSIINGVYDRGGAYGSGTDYTNYNTKTGTKRRTATLGQTFDLGGGLTVQVVCLKGKTISGDSVVIPSGEENGMSMGLLITYNGFKLISGGDIAGYNSGDYKNVESILAPDIGSVNVLHVNHHSSASSSNPTWVSTLNPQVSFISLGAGNSYGYPKAETITRLTSDPGLDNHIYQTETGTGGTIPSGRGHVCNSNIWIVVNSTTYTVWGEAYNIAKDGELAAQEPAVPAVPAYGIGTVHPNPARDIAVIELSAPGPGTAELSVYNLLGQRVRILALDIPQLSSRQIRWDCRDGQGRALPNGVYLLRLSFASGAGRLSSTSKVILMK
jgi:beta-lactamase superfamily II metal-dependent hydrolase